ncbi:MAG: UPF0146 family protein [Archaeoglobales archaeon]|nr:UPF0146 family protein [Archaeoglobales archaeon]
MLGLAEYIIRNYRGKVVEIGIGHYFEVAKILAKNGFEVYATDLKDAKTPKYVKYFIDDVRSPKIEIYRGASLIYSIRPPPEIFEPIRVVSQKVNADCIIKPLYGDFPEGKLVNYKGTYFYVLR